MTQAVTESTTARPLRSTTAEPFILTIFGATGDLTRRKLIPAMFANYREGLLPKNFAIVGYARRDWGDAGFRERAGEMINMADSAKTQQQWNEFCRHLYYHQADLDDPQGYAGLKALLDKLCGERDIPGNYLFYFSTQPRYFAPIAMHLAEQKLSRNELFGAPWTRIIVEKPFGHDLTSSVELNHQMTQSFREDQIYRIDHYLGKETVQNIMVLRFANSIFEPLWNNKYVDHVQVTVAETLGVEGRGGYYDKSGALRDIAQNHVLQLLALVGMEVPVSVDGTAIRNEKVKVLQALRPFSETCARGNVVRAQYGPGMVEGKQQIGYLEEPDIPGDSATETYLAFKTFIDNWRWAGVPFYVRTGKRMKHRVTEVNIHFKHIPQILFDRHPFGPMQPNVLVLRIQPDESIMLQFQIKFPGAAMRIESLKMDFSYQDTFGKSPPEAYQRLLLDAILGDPTLFIHGDEVEQSWRFFEPVLQCQESGIKLPSYASGSWGPAEADDLLLRDGREWRIFETPESHKVCYI